MKPGRFYRGSLSALFLPLAKGLGSPLGLCDLCPLCSLSLSPLPHKWEGALAGSQGDLRQGES